MFIKVHFANLLPILQEIAIVFSSQIFVVVIRKCGKGIKFSGWYHRIKEFSKILSDCHDRLSLRVVFIYSGRKTSEFKWKKTYHTMEWRMLRLNFAWNFPKKFETSSLLATNPYGNKTGQTKRESPEWIERGNWTGM